jgi:hypothetical protein
MYEYALIFVKFIIFHKIMHKCRFGPAYCQYLLTRVLQKFTLHFLKFILFTLNFRSSNLNEFDLTKILEKQKGYCSIWAQTGNELHS